MKADVDPRHEHLVILAKNYVAGYVSKRPLDKMSRAELDETWKILLDASIAVAGLQDRAPAPRAGDLALVAEDGELTSAGIAIVEQRKAEREARRTRRQTRAAGGAA